MCASHSQSQFQGKVEVQAKLEKRGRCPFWFFPASVMAAGLSVMATLRAAKLSGWPPGSLGLFPRSFYAVSHVWKGAEGARRSDGATCEALGVSWSRTGGRCGGCWVISGPLCQPTCPDEGDAMGNSPSELLEIPREGEVIAFFGSQSCVSRSLWGFDSFVISCGSFSAWVLQSLGGLVFRL